MKLHADRHNVERSNVASESAFRIKTTAKAFDILSSGLYTDRILAVVRELSCNAYDAHVAANNPDPFEIHLPNSLEPWFHVKDAGTGLSDEDVMNLYSTYFDSTKTNSNDYIGALGLGSKSPFSYTKAFEVISRFEHVRRTYSIFINEDGVPTIARLGEFVTDEHNGLEVRITVKKDDFWTFHDKVRQALRWFPVKPIVVGTANFDWPKMPKESLSGKGWAMFDSDFADDYSKMTAVQGNVAYKVDISKLDLKSADIHLLENCHIVGFFNIGELEVAASREEIRYDDRSKAALNQRIKDVRAGILVSVEERVKTLQKEGATNWSIMIALNKMADEMFGSYSLFEEFVEPSKLKAIMWYLECDGKLELPKIFGHEVTAYTINRGGNSLKSQIKRSKLGSGVDPDDETLVFFNDVKTGGISRVTNYLRTVGWNSATPIRTAIVIRRFDKPVLFEKPDTTSVVCKQIEWSIKDFIKEYKTINEALGDVEIKLVSVDTPNLSRERNSEYRSMSVFQFEKINHRRYGKSTIVWQRIPVEAIDLEQDSLFFFLRNGAHITVVDATGNEKDVDWGIDKTEDYLKTAVKLINDAQGTSFTMKNVFAVGSQASKKIKKLPNWVNIFDALKTQMVQFKPAVEFFKRVYSTSEIMGIRDCIIHKRNRRSKLIDLTEKLSKKSAFKNTLIPFIEDVRKYETVNTTCTFLQKLDVDLGTKIFDNVSTKEYFTNHSFANYPMLSFVSQFQFLDNNQIDLFFDYIETIDRS